MSGPVQYGPPCCARPLIFAVVIEMDIDLLNEPVKVTYEQKFCYFCRKQIFFELFATLAITWKLGAKSQLTELKQFYSQICLCKFH